MATNIISGLSSGIDWKTMVDQLISVDHQRVDLITNKQKTEQTKLTEWQNVSTKLLALKTAVGNLKDPDAFNVYKAGMSTDNAAVPAAGLLAVTSSTTASAGSYTIKVNNLATAQKISSKTFTTMTSALGITGGLTINGATITIDGADTLLNVRDKINNANAGSTPTGVTAGIVSYGAGDNRLILTSDTTGVGGIIDLSGAPLAAFEFDHPVNELTAGADASLTVNGVPVTRTKNIIADLIPGVTLNLLNSDSSATITLTLGRDTDAIMTKINAFVASYNSISSYIKTQTSYDATKKQTGGVLFGDGTLASIKTDLTSRLTESVWGVSASYATLGMVGVNVDRYGQLSVDNGKLTNLLKTNFNDLVKLFAANVTTSTGSMGYISHGNQTKPGEFQVHIDTIATRSASAPSDGGLDVDGKLTNNEELTITAGKKTAVINLTAGMSMTQIVETINGGMTLGVTAAAVDGQLVLTQDSYGSGHTFTIQQQQGLLWSGGDPAVTSGVDVAGTINGEAATGTGQILKGNAGTVNIDGLSIRYTGAVPDADADAGAIRLTFGVAELFDQALFNITDTFEGYVAFKQESLQTKITGYGTQIDEMEARLERKREMLTNQYVAMETALQKIQSQSAWLTAQTQAAVNGWYKSSSSG
jgi:flagellar hook-associated protein 2